MDRVVDECDGCGRREDLRLVGTEMLCVRCEEELNHEYGEHQQHNHQEDE